MWDTSCEMAGWLKHKLESRLQGEISITSDMQGWRQWQPSSELLPGKSRGRKSLLGCHLWGVQSRTRLMLLSSSKRSRYAEDTLFIAESKEIKSHMIKVKEECEKAGLKLNFQKTLRSWHLSQQFSPVQFSH